MQAVLVFSLRGMSSETTARSMQHMFESKNMQYVFELHSVPKNAFRKAEPRNDHWQGQRGHG